MLVASLIQLQHVAEAALRLVSQVKRLEVKIEREHLLLATLPELSVQLLTIAREHGRLTVASAEATTKANRHTIKLHIRNLLTAGHLTQHGVGRGTWYTLQITNYK